MELEPIWNERILRANDAVVVADLHIGYEAELEEKGVNLPTQTEDMTGKLIDTLKNEDTKRLIINGDLKHNIPQGTWQEYKEIPKALDEWLKHVEQIHLVPGNHDGNIDKYLPNDVIIHDSSGFVYDGVGYFHGHATPSKEVLSTSLLVLAHVHPMVALIDSFKNKIKKECWMKFEYERMEESGEAILMPHFNPLLGGTSVNVKEDPYLGPFLKKEKFSSEEIYLLNGAYLGERIDLLSDHQS